MAYKNGKSPYRLTTSFSQAGNAAQGDFHTFREVTLRRHKKRRIRV